LLFCGRTTRADAACEPQGQSSDDGLECSGGRDAPEVQDMIAPRTTEVEVLK